MSDPYLKTRTTPQTSALGFSLRTWNQSELERTVTGVAMGSLARSTLDGTVWERILVGDTTLRSWVRHFTLKVRLSTRVDIGTGKFNVGGNPAMD